MYQMTQRMQIPVNIQADGTGIVVICPYSAFYTSFVANSDYLPFVQVASGSTVVPYANVPSYASAGPFENQFANVVTYAPDFLYVDYVNT